MKEAAHRAREKCSQRHSRKNGEDLSRWVVAKRSVVCQHQRADEEIKGEDVTEASFTRLRNDVLADHDDTVLDFVLHEKAALSELFQELLVLAEHHLALRVSVAENPVRPVQARDGVPDGYRWRMPEHSDRHPAGMDLRILALAAQVFVIESQRRLRSKREQRVEGGDNCRRNLLGGRLPHLRPRRHVSPTAARTLAARQARRVSNDWDDVLVLVHA